MTGEAPLTVAVLRELNGRDGREPLLIGEAEHRFGDSEFTKAQLDWLYWEIWGGGPEERWLLELALDYDRRGPERRVECRHVVQDRRHVLRRQRDSDRALFAAILAAAEAEGESVREHLDRVVAR